MSFNRVTAPRLVALVLALLLPPESGVAAESPAHRTPFQPYFGQVPPGATPEHFALGVVNTAAIEINGVFSADGRSFFFSRHIDGVFTLFQSDAGEEGWSAPVALTVYADGVPALAVDMAISVDGRSLYFLGKNASGDADGPPDLWVMHREDAADGTGEFGVWGFAEALPLPINSEAGEYYPVLVADGSLYFSSNRPGGYGDSDVYRAQRLGDGSFAAPVNLGPEINTEFNEGDTYVAPDESYLIVSSRRPGGLGDADLYVAFRQADGRWSEPRNLGPTINTDQTDFCPMMTPDGKYLFYSRRIGGSWAEASDAEILWVDAAVLERD